MTRPKKCVEYGFSNMAPFHFIQPSRAVAFRKTYHGSDKSPIPLVNKVTSFEEDLDFSDLPNLLQAFKDHAAQGRALFKGQLSQPLVNQSRQGRIDRAKYTAWGCLDIDGLSTSLAFNYPLHAHDLVTMASSFLSALQLSTLFDVPRVIHASQSAGMDKTKLNFHIFFPVFPEVSPSSLKLWITHVNLSSPFLRQTVSLSPNGTSLIFPLDPSVASNSQLIFIAPPDFQGGVVDPFASIDDRFTAVSGGATAVNIKALLASVSPEQVEQEKQKLISELRVKSNLPKKRASSKVLNLGNQAIEVLTNPDRLHIEVCDASHPDYVRCNVNGGDSRGYYFYRLSPRYMYNFKGEPAWEIAIADPDFVDTVASYSQLVKENIAYSPQVIRDYKADVFFSGLFSSEHKQFDKAYGLPRITRANFPDFYKSNGQYTMPEHIPDADIYFNPSEGEVPVSTSGPIWKVNLYEETEIRKQAVTPPAGIPKPSISNDDAMAACPTIREVLRHVLGDAESYFHFLNWLAYVYQTGQKTMTAWLVTGSQGTGKGVLCFRILRPLLGTSQVVYKDLNNIEEQYNGYLKRAQILVVDEFRVANTTKSIMRLADQLKAQITEPSINIREMYSNAYEAPSYTNYIFFSNHTNAIRIPRDDRRYNVSTRQDGKLEDVIPDFSSTGLLNLEAELPVFAGVLKVFDISQAQVFHPMQNAAKSLLISSGLSLYEEVAEAVLAGDIKYFLDVLAIDPTAIFGNLIPTAQSLVEQMVTDATALRPSAVSLEELRTVVQALTLKSPPIDLRYFRKQLAEHFVLVKKVRDPLTKVQRRAILIPWSESSQDYLNNLGAHEDGSSESSAGQS